MPRVSKYTKEAVANIIKKGKMTKRSDLQKANGSAYNVARKAGWLDQLFGATKPVAPKKHKTMREVKAKARAAKQPSKTRVSAMVTITNVTSMDAIAGILDMCSEHDATASVDVQLIDMR